jgi:RNA polymerase sigma factor (sigma-70 family)
VDHASQPIGAAVLVRDERLARSVADGDQAAFAELYERYQQPLLRYCRSILGGEADSQDVVQSAFVSALAALQRDSRNAPVRPWLYRIAHNEAMSVLRRRGARARLREQLEHQSPAIADWSADRDRLELLIEDLWQLPERQRRALVMRELSGLSHQEIAARLGTSVSSAKQAIFESRRALTEFAEGREAACEDIRAAIDGQDPRSLRSRRIRAHLRECAMCSALAATDGRRAKRLGALVPALLPFGLRRVFHRILHATAPAEAGGGAGISQAAGVVGGSAGATLAAKAITVVALVGATAAAGVAVSSPGNAPASGTTPLVYSQPQQGVLPAAFTTSPLAGVPFLDPGASAGGNGAAPQGSSAAQPTLGPVGSPNAQPAGVSPLQAVGVGVRPLGAGAYASSADGQAPGVVASPFSGTQSAGSPAQGTASSTTVTSTESGSSGAGSNGDGNQSPGTPQGNGPDGAGPPGAGDGNSQGQGLALGHTGGNGQGLALGHANGQGNGNGNGNGNGQGKGNGNGQGNGNANGHASAPGQATAPGQSTPTGQSTPPGQSTAPGQSTPPGQATAQGQSTPPGQTTAPGQSTPPGQANGHAEGLANGNGNGNGGGNGNAGGNGNGKGNGRAVTASSSQATDPSDTPVAAVSG